MKKWIFLFGLLFLPLLAGAQNTALVDNRAKTAPLSAAQTKEQIVDFLTKGLSSPEDKARVLAAYLAYQFQRSGYEQRRLEEASQQGRLADEPLKNDFFKTRVGTSFDFASLYQELCTLAGLKAVVIKGYAGKSVRTSRSNSPRLTVVEKGVRQLSGTPNYVLQQYQAAWNAVQIDNQWQLVDTYWMISGNRSEYKEVNNKRSMSIQLSRRTARPLSLSELTRNKQIDDDYFNAKPRFFIKTHFPLDAQWQRLPVPMTWGNFTDNK